MKRAVVSKLLLIAIGLSCSSAGISQAREVIRQGFDVQVPVSPAPVRIGNATRLRYELHLTNFARKPLSLMRVQVLDAATGEMIADFEGENLQQRLVQQVIAPGMRAVVYLGLPVSEPPEKLLHRIEFHTDDGERATLDAGATDVDRRPLPVLGPPLRGGPWVAVYEPAMERGHRRVVYAVDGRARIPGRFAIDWMKPEGGDTGHGADVLAVADAVVVATRDGMAEPSGDGGFRGSLGEAAGNYIVLDLGHGRYATYEHLKPGLLVKPGDRVDEGEVIAALGITGQGTQPHLHFHVSDSMEPLPAEGLPYLLSGFAVIGAYPGIDAFSRGDPWTRSSDTPNPEPSFPSPNVVVRFPGD